MCINCTDYWKGSKSLGPIKMGSGQVCEDPYSWIAWIRIARFYIGFCPYLCMWQWKFSRSKHDSWMLGGGQTIRLRPKNFTFTLMLGPLDFSWR